MSALGELDEWLERYDASLRFETATACAWSGELRLTLTNPTGAPSRSITFFSAGGPDPEHCAKALLADAKAWLAESDVKPMPIPDWLKGGDAE